MGTCITIPVATQTIQHLISPHVLPQPQQFSTKNSNSNQYTICITLHISPWPNQSQMGEEFIQQAPYWGTGFTLHLGPKIYCCATVLPQVEYITAIEMACLKVPPKIAKELRAETNISHICELHPKPDITKEETKALQELRWDTELYSHWTRQ